MVENYDGCGGEDTLFWQFFVMDMEWTMVAICHAWPMSDTWCGIESVKRFLLCWQWNFWKICILVIKKICLMGSGYVCNGNVNTNVKKYDGCGGKDLHVWKKISMDI
jgi:hypothetical protein